jgi:uncharacterized protein YjbI with pentapeptide repeats
MVSHGNDWEEKAIPCRGATVANPEHVEILRQGRKIWNGWRYENRETGSGGAEHPDFSNATLAGLDLQGVDLAFANMAGAQLDGTNLTCADLACAYLAGANLQGSNLDFANFSNLTIRTGSREPWRPSLAIRSSDSGANLEKASLADCSLDGVNFSRASMIGATFHSAHLSDVRFFSTNLAQSRGLGTCEHFGPSSLDFLTLYESWPLPRSFLRGCGLPDELINYVTSLLDDSTKFHSCFISYSSKDDELAKRLYNDLQERGVRCWFAPEDLKTGAELRRGIDESILCHDKLLLLLSKDSVTSNWVEQEVEKALERERKERKTVLFPIRLDNAVMEVEIGWPSLVRNTRNIADLREWRNDAIYRKVFDRLLRDLKASERPHNRS